jgi:metal-responsive CopG/Arc/MetJ family transcriptional regulator
MKRTSMFFPEPLLEKFRELARKRDLSVAELVRLAMERYLKEQKDGSD